MNPPPMNSEFRGNNNAPNPDLSHGDYVDPTSRQFAGAAVAGAIAGTMLAGPVGLVVVGGGAAIASTTKGKGGDIARKGGDAMANVGDKLKHLNQKHHITEKTKKGFSKAAQEMKDINEKYHITEKAKRAAVKGGQEFKKMDEKHHIVDKAKQSAKDVDEKHNVTDKAKKGIAKGATWVAKQVKPKDLMAASMAASKYSTK